MATNRMEHLAEVARDCATLQCPAHPQGTPFGAYVRSKFFAGGFGFQTFGFQTLESAAKYVDTQRSHAIRDEALSDFSAAIAGADGQVYSLYS